MSESPRQPRAKRQKIDKTGRFAALEKLKNLKGNKNKVSVEENTDSLYEEVDEEEYRKRVLSRIHDNFIDGEDKDGYEDDGRELYEDCYDEDDTKKSAKGKRKETKGSKGKKRLRDDTVSVAEKNAIGLMFSKAGTTKQTVKSSDDNILTDLLDEMKSENIHESNNADLLLNEKLKVNEYLKNLNELTKKPKATEESQEKILRKVLKPTDKQASISKSNNVEDLAVEIVASSHMSPNRLINEGQEIITNKEIKTENITVKDELEDADQNEDISMVMDAEFEVISDVVKSEKLEETVKVKAVDIPEDIIKPESLDWTTMFNEEIDDDFNAVVDENVNISEKLITNDETLKFWYWDAWTDPISYPGEIKLFGKIRKNSNPKEVESTCIHIKSTERCLYLLPREFKLDHITKEETEDPVLFTDVYEEFNKEIATKLKINEFKTKKVSKGHPFRIPGVGSLDVTEFLEVRYKSNLPPPRTNCKYNTIAHIFGTTTSPLETFLLEKKLKGPCWLDIKNYTVDNRTITWCKKNIICESTECITIAEEKSQQPLPLVVGALRIKSYAAENSKVNEILMISFMIHKSYSVDKSAPVQPFTSHFIGMAKPRNQAWPKDLRIIEQPNFPKCIRFDSESALLNWFLKTYEKVDPDIIVTHDHLDFQLDLLSQRISDLNINDWSRLTRLKLSRHKNMKVKDYFVGRLVCDIKHSAEELIKSRNYELATLCSSILNIDDFDSVSNADAQIIFNSDKGICHLIRTTLTECVYILRLMYELNIIPLAMQITNICGNLMSRTLQGGRSERNEYLLLHAFYERNLIPPDKVIQQFNRNDAQTKRKAAYSGGLVLSPVKGLYEDLILLMDFNSLYPSIIQEYNICFTTIAEPVGDSEDKLSLPDSSVELGILPKQVRRLVESRREVKKLLANPDLEIEQRMIYNIRQLALKLTANSMYGCLGFAKSRFFAQHLASLITEKGRDILQNTRDLVQKLNYEVVYGDTDSLMINTHSSEYDQAMRIGLNIKQTVNKTYRQVELDIDGVFKKLLLLKKKKYAAVTVSKDKTGAFIYKKEYKGLDIVRRDWSQITVQTGNIVLNEIFSDKVFDDRLANIETALTKIKDDLTAGTVPLSLLTITKQLTKHPNEYADAKSLPHVSVALRINASKTKKYKKGDVVEYIICNDGTENTAQQRAYHKDEINKNPKLKIDVDYYLSHQIHPVISRICEPINGIDVMRVAMFLGLDTKRFVDKARKMCQEEDDDLNTFAVETEEEKYRFCEQFMFKCIECKTENVVSSPIRDSNVPVLQKCSNALCQIPPYQYLNSIKNQLTLTMRKLIKKYYMNSLTCDEPSCGITDTIAFSYDESDDNKHPKCHNCVSGYLIQKYSGRDLYKQLSYYRYIFDTTNLNLTELPKFSPILEDAYSTLKQHANVTIQKSEYGTINLAVLFPQS